MEIWIRLLPKKKKKVRRWNHRSTKWLVPFYLHLVDSARSSTTETSLSWTTCTSTWQTCLYRSTDRTTTVFTEARWVSQTCGCIWSPLEEKMLLISCSRTSPGWLYILSSPSRTSWQTTNIALSAMVRMRVSTYCLLFPWSQLEIRHLHRYSWIIR